MKQEESPTQFVTCVRNAGCEDLELHKVYQVLPDAAAAKNHHLRVIDESGEDYLSMICHDCLKERQEASMPIATKAEQTWWSTSPIGPHSPIASCKV